MTPDRLEVFPDAEALSAAACDAFCKLASEAIEQRGRFTVSLSGGSTPRRLYQLLAQKSLPWHQIHWFWGDERNVPHSHNDSNCRMVHEALLDSIGAAPETVFPVPVNVADPAAAAAAYEVTLRAQFVGDSFPTWDLALQGMGDDAHTASLFPETKAIDETERWFVENWVPKLDTYRYTLTAPALRSARNIWFFIAGAGKRAALDQVWNGPFQPAVAPSQLIPPQHEGLQWFVTRDALPAGEA